jgi:hypothetical protein
MSDVHLTTIEPDDRMKTWRARCSCGFVGLYRYTVEGAKESARQHEAIERGERPGCRRG